ncbi:MAG: hypothetical protein KAJ19_03740 [Gammaproteobacteria bacterium]|nr:hypothetical protein [Gammaproteobacteria bacterium]
MSYGGIQRVYVLDCDGCSCEFQDGYWHREADTLAKIAEKDGWKKVSSKWLCPECIAGCTWCKGDINIPDVKYHTERMCLVGSPEDYKQMKEKTVLG